MPIWSAPVDRDTVNNHLHDTLCEHLGIEIIEIGDDYLKATMPVDRRTRQYMGIVHGGASVALAETIGSIGSNLCCRPGYYCVGLEINANHIGPGKPPYLTALAQPEHIGSSTMVWSIRISDVDDRLICISRLTMAVLKCKDDSTA